MSANSINSANNVNSVQREISIKERLNEALASEWILKAVFLFLLVSFGLSIYLNSYTWALLLAFIKALVLGYLFMDLHHQHRVFQVSFVGIIILILLGTSISW